MKQLKRIWIFLLVMLAVVFAASCGKGEDGKNADNPTPESVVESFYEAWGKSDVEGIIKLACEPMWKVEAESAEISVEELKAQVKESYTEDIGSEVYYRILKTTEYDSDSKEFKEVYDWAKGRYGIEIEGYAKVRTSVTYDNGEPVTSDMEVVKYEGSWYARDLIGV